MDSYTVFWREMLVFKRTFWKFLTSRLVSPVLYLVAFGWGLGRSILTDGGLTWISSSRGSSPSAR